MSSALSLIVLGQVYFLGPVTNIPSNTPNSSLITSPVIYQPKPPHQVKRSDYIYVPGVGSYKFHTAALKWAEARLICEEEGGHLAIVNSVAESNEISQIFPESKSIVNSEYSDDAFIGYHDFFREGEYVTVHGESLHKAGYDQWAPDQPNGSSNQNCGGINRNGRLNDLWCDKRFAFICEIPIA